MIKVSLLLALFLSQVSVEQCKQACRSGKQVELMKECEKQGNPRAFCKTVVEQSLKQCDETCDMLRKAK